MYDTVWFVIIGYLCGSVLFARCLEKLSGKNGYLESSPDGNPEPIMRFGMEERPVESPHCAGMY